MDVTIVYDVITVYNGNIDVGLPFFGLWSNEPDCVSDVRLADVFWQYREVGDGCDVFGWFKNSDGLTAVKDGHSDRGRIVRDWVFNGQI